MAVWWQLFTAQCKYKYKYTNTQCAKQNYTYNGRVRQYARWTAVYGTMGANWNPRQICYFCSDLLFLHKSAQMICYSCTNLLFTVHTSSCQVVKHKGGPLLADQRQDHLHNYWNIPLLFQIPAFKESNSQRSRQAAPHDDTVWSLIWLDDGGTPLHWWHQCTAVYWWHQRIASQRQIKGGSFPTRCETPGTPWCHPSLKSPFLLSSASSKIVPCSAVCISCCQRPYLWRSCICIQHFPVFYRKLTNTTKGFATPNPFPNHRESSIGSSS